MLTIDDYTERAERNAEMDNFTHLRYCFVIVLIGNIFSPIHSDTINPSLTEGRTLSESKVMQIGSDWFVPNTLVLTLQHALQAAELGDPEVYGKFCIASPIKFYV